LGKRILVRQVRRMNHNQLSNSARQEDILIVDDTLHNVRLLSEMLQKQGYTIRKALNGKMAIMAVQARLPDLILLDIMMPDMDGYQVCQHLKADPQTAEIPVIFLSALDDVFDKVKAFVIGGADYITKPFQFEEVLVRVRNQLAITTADRAVHQLQTELEEQRARTHDLEIAYDRSLQAALHDPLTGLLTRSALLQHLEHLLIRIQANSPDQFALVLLDCDKFESIDRSLGHAVGDEVLTTIAHHLKTCLSPADAAARVSDHTFAVLLSELPYPHYAAQVAEQMVQLFAKPFRLKTCELSLRAQTAVVFGHSDYSQPEHLLRDAHSALSRQETDQTASTTC
jgi:diguanylate cyclase (GGDEF)-like protein